MFDYALVRHAHIVFALLSITGFVVRAWWMWHDSPKRRWRISRTLPHLNDTLLLIAGIWMVVVSAQYPWTHAWLGAKLAALVVYILLGMVALKRGKTRNIRLAAAVGAVVTFGYILAAAHLRTPWPFVF